MFGTGEDAQRAAEVAALKASDRRFAQVARQLGRFAEAFIRSPPPLVARDRDAWRERPLDAGGAHLFGRHARGALDEARVARAAQTYVVREDGRAEHVAVAVHRVYAVENRDAEPSLDGARLVLVVNVRPGFEAVAGLRVGVAAAQERAEE